MRSIVPETRLFTPQPERLPWSGQVRRAKLRVPGLPADAVDRPRLLRQVEEAGRPLTLIVAPAGFGKTTFVAQWACQGFPTAWLSVDHRDNLLDRFWAHLREAFIETVPDVPDLGDLVSLAMAMPYRATALDLGRLFADELLDVPEVRIVIEDLHQIVDAQVFDFLAGLLEIAPIGLRLVMTSRVEPPLPLNRMRLRGAMTEIRSDDLLFTASEADAFVAQFTTNGGKATAPPEARPQRVPNSGWAAGLRLAALAYSPHGVPDMPGHAAGSEQELLDSLVEETLAGRSPGEREVLLWAALPERFNPRLVMAMVDASLPAAVVRDAIDFGTRADLCRRSARRDGNWLEFHPLFRETLLRQLEREAEPGLLRDVHRRAAIWFEEAGNVDEAIEHRLAAGDVAGAVAIVVREIRPALNREDWPSVARWLARLPAEVIRKTPRLLLAQGMILQFRGQPVPLAEMQIALEAQLARGELSAAEIATLRGEFDSLRLNSSYSDAIDVHSSLQLAQRAMQGIDPAHRYELGVARMYYGATLAALGRYEEAVHRTEEWIDEAGVEIDAGSIRPYFGLMMIHAQAGNLTLLESAARTTIPLAEQHGLRIMAAWGHRFLGLVLYEFNDLAGAIEQFSAIGRDHEYAHLKALRESLFGLALAYRAADREDEAFRAMRRAHEIATSAGMLHDLPIIEAKQAYLALLCGDREAAERWARVHNPSLGVDSLGLLVHPTVIHAAILCASPDRKVIGRGLRELDHVRQEMMKWRHSGPLVRIDALRAVALLRSGQRHEAIEAMRAACATARPHGHVRAFLDLQPIFSHELDNLDAAVMLPTAAQQALRRADTPALARDSSGENHGPLETLTEREQEVLVYLSQRFSYREIGDQLYISPHTVKRHVTSIYSKLAVTGRVDAIRMARELGWTA